MIKEDKIKKRDNIYIISDKEHKGVGKKLYLSKSTGRYYYEDKNNTKFFFR